MGFGLGQPCWIQRVIFSAWPSLTVWGVTSSARTDRCVGVRSKAFRPRALSSAQPVSSLDWIREQRRLVFPVNTVARVSGWRVPAVSEFSPLTSLSRMQRALLERRYLDCLQQFFAIRTECVRLLSTEPDQLNSSSTENVGVRTVAGLGLLGADHYALAVEACAQLRLGQMGFSLHRERVYLDLPCTRVEFLGLLLVRWFCSVHDPNALPISYRLLTFPLLLLLLILLLLLLLLPHRPSSQCTSSSGNLVQARKCIDSLLADPALSEMTKAGKLSSAPEQVEDERGRWLTAWSYLDQPMRLVHLVEEWFQSDQLLGSQAEARDRLLRTALEACLRCGATECALGLYNQLRRSQPKSVEATFLSQMLACCVQHQDAATAHRLLAR
jgi:hypothetical protein